MNLVKTMGLIFFFVFNFFVGASLTYGQGLPIGDQIYDMKRSDLKGFELLRKREWLKKVIQDAQNIKQEIASKDGRDQKEGRTPAGIINKKSQQEWEKEIDLLLRDQEE